MGYIAKPLGDLYDFLCIFSDVTLKEQNVEHTIDHYQQWIQGYLKG